MTRSHRNIINGRVTEAIALKRDYIFVAAEVPLHLINDGMLLLNYMTFVAESWGEVPISKYVGVQLRTEAFPMDESDVGRTRAYAEIPVRLKEEA